MEHTHYIVPTSSGDADESLSAGTVLEKNLSSRLPENSRHARDRQPLAHRTTPMTTLGCLATVLLVMLGCCFLAGPIGLAITGAVVIVVVNSVGRTLVQLRQCETHQAEPLNGEVVPPAPTPEVPPLRKESPMPGASEEPTPRAFWEALSPDERHAFVSAAEERTFASGATLVTEGEKADHVILIQSGWTKICVDELGQERIIAERGPGQLVGERAALQVNLRSASVIALETVRALVMPTADFADFVGAHPRVLDIVEGQVYDRLTTPIGEFRHGRPGGGLSPVSPERRPTSTRGGPFNGENCTIIFTDVAGFGSQVRNDEDRQIVRKESHAMIGEAFTAAGIAWESCHCEDRGDGLLIVVPAHIPTKTVLDGLPIRLAAALKRHNHRSSEAVRIQLRVAVHVGPVTTDSIGQSGEAIIHAARLVDAPELKRGITNTAASLGVIVSAFVYDTVIKHGDPDGFSPVKVKVKEARLDAWMQLTGRALTS